MVLAMKQYLKKYCGLAMKQNQKQYLNGGQQSTKPFASANRKLRDIRLRTYTT